MEQWSNRFHGRLETMRQALRELGLELFDDPDAGYVVVDAQGRQLPMPAVSSYIYDGQEEPDAAARQIALHFSLGIPIAA